MLDKHSGQLSEKRATRKIKDVVGGVGDKLRFAVHAASCRYDGIGEWLYDLCWCEQDEFGHVLDMPLALECEWQLKLTSILDDFQKLLVSQAGHRIFLCSQPTAEDWQDCVEHLTEQIRLYRGTRNGDRYLLGCWASDGWKFMHYVHPTVVPRVTRAWLFQATQRYDLTKELRRRESDRWTVGRNRVNLRPGNIAILWQSGEDAGIYGLGELTSRVTDERRGTGKHSLYEAARTSYSQVGASQASAAEEVWCDRDATWQEPFSSSQQGIGSSEGIVIGATGDRVCCW